jgi:hypothetical protein
MNKEKFISFDQPLKINIKNYNNIEFLYEDTNLNIHNEKTKNSKEINFNFYNKNQFNGIRHKNLTNCNIIRNGTSSRNDSKEYKESKESLQMFDHQFGILNNNNRSLANRFNDSEIPRGGIMTRKNNNNNNNIDFKY